MLSGLVICVFISTALTLARVLPGPHNPLDYLVIGAVSVLLSLVSAVCGGAAVYPIERTSTCEYICFV